MGLGLACAPAGIDLNARRGRLSTVFCRARPGVGNDKEMSVRLLHHDDSLPFPTTANLTVRPHQVVSSSEHVIQCFIRVVDVMMDSQPRETIGAHPANVRARWNLTALFRRTCLVQ